MLTRLILIATVAFCVLLSISEGSPQRCEETSIQYNAVFSNFSIAIFADLKISSADGNITVTNINATATNTTNTDMQFNFKRICAWGRSGDIFACNNQFTDNVTINVGASNVLELQMGISMNNSIYESDDEAPPFYSGVVDGNGFSFYDGRLYDDNNTCYSYTFQDGSAVTLSLSECCTSMKPLNITTTNTQTCTHFTSATTIAKPGDANPYASINFDYDISNNNVTMIGKYNASSVEYNPYLIIDDAQGCAEVLNGSIYCGYPLSDGGNKLLVFMSESFNMTQIYGFAGRMVVRDGLALMNDIDAFTPNNTCQTFNATYDSSRNLMISTTSCCTSFQVYTPPDGSSSPSPQTTSVGTTTTSGAKSVSVINFFSLFLVVIVSFLVFNV